MLLAALLLLLATPAQAASAPDDNARLTALFDADQHDRADGDKMDWPKVMLADDARRAEVAAMLKAGTLRTGADYWHAAFIFQHGDEPRDYLLAHTLAVTAVSQGYPKAAWIAAATLDRYLGAVGQPQVYGTQYRGKPGRATTQEPYDRTLVNDVQRRAAGVETLAEQEAKRQKMDADRARAAAPR